MAHDKAQRQHLSCPIVRPGHSASWRFGYPEVVPDCPITIAGNDANAALDPSNEKTFDVLAKLLGELGDIFPDSYFHLGGTAADSAAQWRAAVPLLQMTCPLRAHTPRAQTSHIPRTPLAHPSRALQAMKSATSAGRKALMWAPL